MVDPQDFTDEEVIREIQSLIDCNKGILPDVRLVDSQHYLDHGENELAYEYIMLEIIESENGVISGSVGELIRLGLHLGMDKNDWTDESFWQKVCTYLDTEI